MEIKLASETAAFAERGCSNKAARFLSRVGFFAASKASFSRQEFRVESS
jgi:hypothetical protein